MKEQSEQLERIVGFSRYLEESCSETVFSSSLATALLCESLPLVSDRNYLRVEDTEAGASQLAALADRIMELAGLSQRKIVVDSDQVGERLAPQFASLGWKVERAAVMVHSGSLEDEEQPLVTEASAEEMLPFWEQVNRELHPHNEDLARQLSQENVLIQSHIDSRYLVRRMSGRIVSACHLYSRGATAEIDGVATLQEFRNRGLATSVVRRAVAEAFLSGHDLVWLLADEDDWPRALYESLGFYQIGRFYGFGREA